MRQRASCGTVQPPRAPDAHGDDLALLAEARHAPVPRLGLEALGAAEHDDAPVQVVRPHDELERPGLDGLKAEVPTQLTA